VVGSCGIYVTTKSGSVFCTGDWKIDETPLLGDKVNTKQLTRIGQEGVDCLLCDSTNILTDENIGSENDVKEELLKVFKQHKDKRITITCFASNLARMETIFNIAIKEGRKIAIIGRSMHKMIDAISKTDYFSKDFKAGLSATVTENEAMDMPPYKVVFICTGSQGEFRSALYKIARGENKIIKLGDKDVVVFSSKIIPGNEIGIRDLQNALVKSGVEIITSDTHEDIHVSGHPNKAAVAMMYKWTNPKSCIPIHGDPYMLYGQAKFARENGIQEVCVAESGDIISVKNGKLKKIGHDKIGMSCIDGKDIIKLDSQIIKERAIMSCNGHVGVSFVLDYNGRLLHSPDISISGIHIVEDIKNNIHTLIYQIITNEISLYKQVDQNSLKERIKNSVKRMMHRYFEKRPQVSVHIHQS
jgi:ribonuclease J